MKHLTCAFLVLSWLAATASADSWIFPKKLVTKNSEFGESKLVLEIDGTKDQAFPPHTLSVYGGGQLLAKYRNVGFHKVYASKDNKYFVGLSNSAIPGTAFVVFDAAGNLLREEKHDFLPHAMYTFRSITVLRVWFHEKNPDVEFDVQDGRLVGVFVRGSNNQKYNLLQRDLDFREVGVDRPPSRDEDAAD